MRIPQAVKEAAKWLSDCHDTRLYHVGEYQGYEVFTLEFFDDSDIGFPEVYLYKKGEEVITIQDSMSLDIISMALENKNENKKHS